MDRKTEPKSGASSQRDRSIETARKLGADQDAETLDRVFGKVVPPVVPKIPSKDEDKPAD